MPATRYLIVKLAALGDVAMASTLVGAIRARDPHAHITWLCGARVSGLVHCFPGVDEVLEVDEVSMLRGRGLRRLGAILAMWRRLGHRRFDRTALAHADPRYRLLLRPIRCGTLRMLSHEPSPRMLPIPGRYVGDELVRLLDDADSQGPIVGHAPLLDLRASLPARGAAAPVGIILVPGGTRNVLRESALRRWPVERYRALAASLVAAGHVVTLVGDGGDDWVRPFFEGIPVRDEIGRHDIAGTLALLRDADVMVSHDTGPLHLCRLVRTPLVALFGPTMPSQFIVEDERTQAIWGGHRLACRPCYDGREFADCARNRCMEEIGVADVERAVTDLLRRRDAEREVTPLA